MNNKKVKDLGWIPEEHHNQHYNLKTYIDVSVKYVYLTNRNVYI